MPGTVRVLPAPEPPRFVTFSPDGARLAAAGESNVLLWTIGTAELRTLGYQGASPLGWGPVSLPMTSTYVTTVAFSTDGRAPWRPAAR